MHSARIKPMGFMMTTDKRTSHDNAKLGAATTDAALDAIVWPMADSALAREHVHELCATCMREAFSYATPTHAGWRAIPYGPRWGMSLDRWRAARAIALPVKCRVPHTP